MRVGDSKSRESHSKPRGGGAVGGDSRLPSQRVMSVVTVSGYSVDGCECRPAVRRVSGDECSPATKRA